MDSPALVLVLPNSKIFSTLQAMTRATHHSPNHAATGLIACYPTLATHATVCLSRSYFLLGPARLAYERIATFLFIFLFHVQSIRLSSSQMALALPFR